MDCSQALSVTDRNLSVHKHRARVADTFDEAKRPSHLDELQSPPNSETTLFRIRARGEDGGDLAIVGCDRSGKASCCRFSALLQS